MPPERMPPKRSLIRLRVNSPTWAGSTASTVSPVGIRRVPRPSGSCAGAGPVGAEVVRGSAGLAFDLPGSVDAPRSIPVRCWSAFNTPCLRAPSRSSSIHPPRLQAAHRLGYQRLGLLLVEVLETDAHQDVLLDGHEREPVQDDCLVPRAL